MAGIYVHIPFCLKKCGYCDFVSFAGLLDKQDLYTESLLKEIDFYTLDGVVDSIFFGGGTPCLLSEKNINAIINKLYKKFKISVGAEMSIEINPAAIDSKKADCLLSVFNRFSVGLQSGDDKTLKYLGRAHTVNDFIETCGYFKNKNLNADILIGLPEQSEKDIKKSIQTAIDCGSKHISCYALEVKEGTPLYNVLTPDKIPSGDQTAKLYDFTVDFLEKNGIKRYEISNFCQKGFECRHNLNYWRGGEYLGLGTAAHSFIKNNRFSNTESFDEYVEKTRAGIKPTAQSDTLSRADLMYERIILSLRLAEGLDIEKFNREFSADFMDEYKDSLSRTKNYLDIKNGRIKIKNEYLFVENKILSEFCI